MTTTVHGAHAPLPETGGGGGRQTFGDVLASEWLKLRTVRSTLYTLVALSAGSVLLTFLICTAAAPSIARDRAGGHPDSGAIVLLGVALVGQISALVLGVMTVTAEYSTGGIRTTLTAVPRRTEVLVTKGILLGLIVSVLGVATAFACYFAGNVPLRAKGVGVNLSEPGVTRALFGSGLYLAGLAVFGLAIGLLLRHTAGAVTVGLALIFIVGGLVGLIPGSVGRWLYKLMPGNAGSQIVTFGADSRDSRALAPWAGFWVFVLEVAVLLVVGAVLFERRDA